MASPGSLPAFDTRAVGGGDLAHQRQAYPATVPLGREEGRDSGTAVGHQNIVYFWLTDILTVANLPICNAAESYPACRAGLPRISQSPCGFVSDSNTLSSYIAPSAIEGARKSFARACALAINVPGAATMAAATRQRLRCRMPNVCPCLMTPRRRSNRIPLLFTGIQAGAPSPQSTSTEPLCSKTSMETTGGPRRALCSCKIPSTFARGPSVMRTI